MHLPLKYNIRNVLIRWRATLATVLGIALVVAVYVLVLSMAVGLEQSSANTGDPRNLIIVRKGSTSESSSLVGREPLKTLQYSLKSRATNKTSRCFYRCDRARDVAASRHAHERRGALRQVLQQLRSRSAAATTETNAVGEANLFAGVLRAGSNCAAGHAVARAVVRSGRREVVVSRRLVEPLADFNVGDSFKAG